MIKSVDLRAPCLLIKAPQHHEHAHQPFYRSVVLMVQHGAHSSMGLCLTQAMDTTVAEFADGLGVAIGGAAGRPLILDGGPVEPARAFILHASSHQGPETEVLFDDVRLSFSLESLRLIAESPPRLLKVLQGYAGWGPGQLASELTQGSWLVGEAQSDLLFDVPPDKIWEEALRRQNILPLQLGHAGARN